MGGEASFELEDAGGEIRALGNHDVGRPGRIRRYPADRPVATEIAIVPMTEEQRQTAVFALAALIARWEQAGCPTDVSDEID